MGTEVGRLIWERRRDRKLSLRGLAIKADMSHAEVRSIEHGERVKPDQSILIRIEDALDFPRGELLRAAGYYSPDWINPPSGPMVEIPILGTITAGRPLFAAEHREGSVEVPLNTVLGGQYYYLRVKGDSMKGDDISDGSLVLVRLQSTTEPHEIAVVLVNGDEATIKRVKQYGNMVSLRSSNPAYQDIDVPVQDVRILGKVVKVEKWLE